MCIEIGFALFDSYVVVNSFIAWRNHILSGRPTKERAYMKYGIREARLKLITRWAKRCSRHYQRTRSHKQKRLRLVILLYWLLVTCAVLYIWGKMHSCACWRTTSWQTRAVTTNWCEAKLSCMRQNNELFLLGLYYWNKWLLPSVSF